jgi:hypothetical protein
MIEQTYFRLNSSRITPTPCRAVQMLDPSRPIVENVVALNMPIKPGAHERTNSIQRFVLIEIRAAFAEPLARVAVLDALSLGLFCA